MLEVQLVRRSRQGVVILVARSDRPDLVEDVADPILTEMEGWSFKNEVLVAFAERERTALKSILRDEGVGHAR